MLTFKKDDFVKYIDPQSDLVPLLKDAGWVVEGDEPTEDDDLKSQAKKLGIRGAHLMKAETLEAKIKEALDDNSE